MRVGPLAAEAENIRSGRASPLVDRNRKWRRMQGRGTGCLVTMRLGRPPGGKCIDPDQWRDRVLRQNLEVRRRGRQITERHS